MKNFPELEKIEELAEKASRFARVKILAQVPLQDRSYPIHSFSFGSENPSDPCFGIFGGVHGLERIGAQAAIAYLDNLVASLEWDEDLREKLKNFRIVSIPLINPAGFVLQRRSNANGVDLMRNAPIEAKSPTHFLVAGHSISPKLPWYRGKPYEQMELESQVLIQFVKEQMFPSTMSLAVDVHSGFGSRDRLWYPFANGEAFPREKEANALKDLMRATYQNHIYVVEPQSNHYVTHGDLWDHLFLEQDSKKVFLPWTLEMGSWMWVRKNPMQIFSSLGAFNPIQIHRLKRILRRHLTLFDFLARATKNHKAWLPEGSLEYSSSHDSARTSF